ncbi:MAG: TIGR04282 family arsenosugar biosynthesis glycosyltransferase [Planctomycetia bacterium]
MTVVVAVFLKHPTPGRVKTRLAAALGAVEAARLYADWVGRILASLDPLRKTPVLPDNSSYVTLGWYAGGAAADFALWDDFVDRWEAQPDLDLGGRLDALFRRAFAGEFTAGAPPKAVVAVGTDCLDVNATVIADAVRRLDRSDVALGPAFDGGYYLLASRKYVAGLFADVRWSTEHAAADQNAACLRCGLTVDRLPPLRDLDDAEAWAAYQAENAVRSTAAVDSPS